MVALDLPGLAATGWFAQLKALTPLASECLGQAHVLVRRRR